jgi:hypothetical protein
VGDSYFRSLFGTPHFVPPPVLPLLLSRVFSGAPGSCLECPSLPTHLDWKEWQSKQQ